jgi:hypothetical protein
MDTTTKLKRNAMSGVWCGILSKDGASYMNARATIIDGRRVKKNGDGTIYTLGSSHFFGCSPASRKRRVVKDDVKGTQGPGV